MGRLQVETPDIGENPAILVLSVTEGYTHQVIPTANQAIQDLVAEIGDENDVDFTVDVLTGEIETGELDFPTSADELAQYDVIVWNTTTGNVLNEDQQAAFEEYIQNGGGYMGIHSASDTEYDWEFYGELVGAYFDDHPPAPDSDFDQIQEAEVHVTDQTHPSTSHLPAVWTRSDEWYNYQSNPRGDVHVLATLDQSTYNNVGFNGSDMGYDHPIAWAQYYQGARSFYTGGGHTEASYEEEDFLQHLKGGLMWAAGYTDGSASGTIWDNYEKVPLDTDTEAPVMLDVAPNGDVFYIEHAPFGGGPESTAEVNVIDQSGAEPETTVALELTVYAGQEDGLQGILLDSDFENTGWVYLYWSPPNAEIDEPHNRLSRFTYENGSIDPESEVEVLRVPTQRDECCHTGGDMHWGPDGEMLYLTTGDDTNPFQSNGYSPIDERDGRQYFDAQRTSANTNDLRGKVLRIIPNEDGSYDIPEDNLFPGGSGSGDGSYAGDRSVQISSTEGADASWGHTVSVEPNTEYTYTAYIKTENLQVGEGQEQVDDSPYGATISVEPLSNANYPDIDQSVIGAPRLTGTNDWTEVSTTFNSGDNSELNLIMLYGGYGTATGSAWFDSVSLTDPNGNNVLSNGGFEEGSDTPMGWSTTTYTGTAEFTYVESSGGNGGSEGTKPEIYTMGSRNPYRASVDQETGTLYWADYGPDAGSWNADRGQPGIVEHNKATEAGFYGWPYFTGPNIPFVDGQFVDADNDQGYTFEPDGPFDPANPTNDSPNNDGLTDLPAAQETMIYYPYSWEALLGSPPEYAQEYLPDEAPWPQLTGGAPMSGPVFRSSEDHDSSVGLPASFDGKYFMMEWGAGWIKYVSFDDDGNVMEVDPFLPNTEFLHPMDMKVGPDGSLYVVEWGSGAFAPTNDDSGIYRINHSDVLLPLPTFASEEVSVEVGGSTTVEATLTNSVSSALESGEVTLSAPDGSNIEISGASGTTFDSIAPGESQSMSWDVAAPDSTGSYTLTATVTYTYNGQAVEQTVSLTLDVTDAATVSVPFGYDAGGDQIDGTVMIDGVEYVDSSSAVTATGNADASGNGATVAQNFTTDSIADTENDALFQSEEYGGDLSYAVDIANGTYDVTLYFAEFYWGGNGNGGGVGSRVFDVSVEGQQVFEDLDIFDQVGHDTALVETVEDVEVTDGTLNITSATSVDNSKFAGFSITASDPLQNGLEAYYSLDEDTPTNEVTGTDATINGEVTTDAEGIVGNAYELSTDGSIDTSADSVVSEPLAINGEGATVGLWMNATEFEEYGRAFQVGGTPDGTPTDGWDIEFSGTDSALTAQLWNDGGTGVGSGGSAISIDTGSWYFVVAVATGGDVRLHVFDEDGELDASPQMWTGGSRTQSDSAPLIVGSGDGRDTAGRFDEVWAYSRALSADEVAQLHTRSLEGGDGPTTIELGAQTTGWVGEAPSSIEGQTNPTLEMTAGEEYTVTFENLDGNLHDFHVLDSEGNEIAGAGAPEEGYTDEIGATASVTFTATEEMAEYYCSAHPNSMRGDVEIVDDEEGFVSLFDGESITDSYWHQINGQANYFVEDGAIVGSSVPEGPNSFLTSYKMFDDFELRMEVNLDPEGLNSGIQVRSNSSQERPEAHGPQAEIELGGEDNGQFPPPQAGRVWGESLGTGWMSSDESTGDLFDNDGWNDYRIRAEDDTLEVYLNGEQTADIDLTEFADVEGLVPYGFMGLQVHSIDVEGRTVRWRNIRVRELDADEWMPVSWDTDGDDGTYTLSGEGLVPSSETYDDFMFETWVRGDTAGGLVFRSSGDGSDGYRVDIDPTDSMMSGSLYDIGAGEYVKDISGDDHAQMAYHPDQWNYVRVRAQGGDIRVWVNGITTAWLSDDAYASGSLGMQHLGGDGTVEFRETSVTMLEGDENPAAEYADENGVVQAQGLVNAINDWRSGSLDTDTLTEVIDYWRTGETVE
ncbi:ThuA domain-containing protein [Salinigranum sp. GCM10025319]|uniref:ThuA domain-containing protein n=1 Tax=Salinigranum sp. GCM10025319 TaxID=3252687 RepID=UPI00360A19D8